MSVDSDCLNQGDKVGRPSKDDHRGGCLFVFDIKQIVGGKGNESKSLAGVYSDSPQKRFLM